MQEKTEERNFLFKTKQMLKNIWQNKPVLLCGLLSLLYLISGYAKWIEIVVCAIAVVSFACFSVQKSFCVFLFLHNFTLSNNEYDSWFVVTFLGFCSILCIKYLIGLKQKKYAFNKKIVVLIAVFLLTYISLSLFKNLYDGAWIYIAYLPLCYLIFEMRKELKITQAINFMFAGLLISVGMAVFSLILPRFQYEVFYANRFRTLTNHPNYLYMRALFVLCFYMYCYLKKEIRNYKFLIIYGLCSAITLSTLSKTGAGMLILMTIVFMILYLKEDFKNRIKVVSIFLLVILLISASCYQLILKVVERFSSDLNSKNILSAILTGRDEIWSRYLKEIFKSPTTALFGNGLLTKRVYIPSQMKTMEPHNFYLFLLYRFGIVGVVALGCIVYLIIKALNKSKPELIAYLPLVYILVESLFDNTFKCYNIIYFILAVMILFKGSKEKNN